MTELSVVVNCILTMKKCFIVISITLAALISSCTNELDTLSQEAKKEKLDVLEFATETDFLLASQDPQKALEQLVQPNVYFKSLYNEYEDAWKVEEEYYVSEEKYKEFKKVFSHLYFPEYQDDYSFFLPVSNENMAKLLTPDGDVRIGGQLVNYIDITQPEDLLKMGRLSSSKKANIATRTEQDNTVYCNEIPEMLGHEGDRKMWVKTYTGFVTGAASTWVEVNFRKKGAFGKWKNYSSTVSLQGTLRYATGHSTIFTRATVKEGKSPLKFEAFAPNIGYNPFPCTSKKLEIGYQGIGGLVYYLEVDTSKL